MRAFAVLTALFTLGTSHPGGDHVAELVSRGEFLRNHMTNLDHCAGDLEASGVTKRSIERRLQLVKTLREKRGLVDSHDVRHPEARYVSDFDRADLFKSTASCVLAPEEMVGPYYVAGESVRPNIVENQQGIPLEIDIQFIDAMTCEPVAEKYVDVWQANATGVYGGVVNGENGSGGNDPGNIRKTFLRGLQPTDKDGVVKFSTIFPGHYAGRTIHIHTMLHPNARPYPNGTIIDTTAAYVGQMYFDQDLIHSVERTQPYASNRNTLTLNSQDFILQQDLQQGGNPFMEYKLVGSRLEDGILAWLSYGINPAERSRVEPVGTRRVLQPRETPEAEKVEE
ncbi:hypothetical protein QQS21_002047 [Conoideocrella luteorostrata]|uniref:Intradiol ring-cleavage dioxygenases domain-containing protein n=1 Tax=Conoideocrella luteorostrata TaxID=1105319 RepID=A0AAJ0G351_9HYPO|nr:hypothetical protein QQS21_002047 [Conoideocrella luteorostrata]